MERVSGIEPPPSAWKAEVLPLNYTRLFFAYLIQIGGGGRIRTYEGINQQIYSLPPLAAWVPLRGHKPAIVWSERGGVNGNQADFFSAILRERSPCSNFTRSASPSVSPKQAISLAVSSPCSADVMACS